ncbi:DEAD/DEAH box helicase family protein [Bacillus cereus]|uniref:DEAD/DEAH box helicase family protein n=1 Tax=Bacillus cereus TaxID=1396 RepID=UPI002490A144|nr:DEAD/DEAH box helicase family protein [Bacillus cereus]
MKKKRKSKVGRIYGGKESRRGLIDIGLFQTVTRYENSQDLLRDYGMIIVDEAHHVAAKTFEDVMKQVASKYVYGLTATPQREDGLENIIFMRVGEISYTAEKEIPKHIKQKLFIRFTFLGEQMATIINQTIHENYEMMIESKDRNQQIISDILSNLKDNRHIIVLSRCIKHIDLLKDELERINVTAPIYILNSKMKNRQLREELANLKQEGKPFVLLTTGSYAGEGFDLPALDTLLLVMPISSKGNLQQYLGRLLRNLDEKEDLRVYDYIDYAIPMMYRMYQKRLRTYKKLGYHLFEDEYTELCKSNLFSEGYEPILQKDLANAQQKILLIMPYLSKSIIEFLNAVHFVRGIERTLFLPEAMMVDSKSRQYVDQLMSIGYRIIFKCNIHQTFVVIDGNLVWLVPNQSRQKNNELALRMYSSEIAKRLQERLE